MLKTVGIQAIASLLGAAVAGWWFSWTVGLSVLVGGASAVIPNGLFALRLTAHRNKPPETYPVVFFVGELTKIGLTIAMLGIAYKWLPEVNGAGLLSGFIVTLKAPMLVLFFSYLIRRNNGFQF